MTKVAGTFFLITIMGATIGCDRVTKRMATASLAEAAPRSLLGDIVRLEYAENTGGFLGIGADFEPRVRTAIFTIGTCFILIGVLIAAIKLRGHPWHLVGACLAFAGGASNLLDRIKHGAVVDFLNVGLGDHLRTGIFNVADVAIMMGICMLMIPLRLSKKGTG